MTDVIVVGSGIAGLMTALAAHELGLSVSVVEKESLLGGTSAYSEAMVWVPCSAAARRAGLVDSREHALEYLRAASGPSARAERLAAYVDSAAEALEFLEANAPVRYQLTTSSIDYDADRPGATRGARALTPLPFDGRCLGSRFKDLRPPLASTMIFGGMSISGPDLKHFYQVWRSARSTLVVGRLFARYVADRVRGYPRGTVLTGGNAVLGGLLQALDERRVSIALGAPAQDLIVDRGRVAGVKVDHRGRRLALRARRAVVLASGGFPRDAERLARFYPHARDGKAHYTLCGPGNTGDGASLAERAGGRFDATVSDAAAWTPASLVPTPAGPVPFPHFGDRAKPGVIAVDRRGHRFVNEATTYHRFVPAMIEACRDDPSVEVFLIADRRAQRRYGLGAAPPFPGRVEPFVRSGYLATAPTVAGLARALGIDAGELVRTVERFNTAAARGEDPEFGRGRHAYDRANGDATHTPNPCLSPLIETPFYAVRVVPGDLGTFAGLDVDVDGRVLDAKSEPIPGLYAVGTDAASPMAGAYPAAGVTVGAGIISAYRAARALNGDP